MFPPPLASFDAPSTGLLEEGIIVPVEVMFVENRQIAPEFLIEPESMLDEESARPTAVWHWVLDFTQIDEDATKPGLVIPLRA